MVPGLLTVNETGRSGRSRARARDVSGRWTRQWPYRWPESISQAFLSSFPFRASLCPYPISNL